MKTTRHEQPAAAQQNENATALATTDAGKQSMFGLASLALSVLIYVAIAWAVFQGYHPAPPDLTQFLPELRVLVKPEPQERLCYLLGLACIVVLPTLFWAALARWDRLRPKDWAWLQSPQMLLGRDVALAGGLVLWIIWLAIHTEMPVSRLRLGLAIPLLPAMIYFARQSMPSNRCGAHVLAGVLLLLLTSLLVVDEAWYWKIWSVSHHFELLLGAVNQVHHGKTILVDTASQYGILYPYIAAMVLAPWELTVTHISLFFAAMSLLTFVLFYWMICEKVGYRSYWSLLFLIPFLAVTHPFFGSGWFVDAGFSAEYNWIYYQYHPLRVLCGAFFLGFVPWYFRHQKPWLMVFGYLASGFAVLWNMDTGMVVLLAWTGVLVFDRLALRPIAIGRLLAGIAVHISLFLLTLAGSFATYAIWARFRSGQFPQPDLFLKYQSIFYGAGFMMLPMRLWEWWQPVILIYVVTIADCLRRVIRGSGEARVRWYFFIAIYGLGIFSYYQGRSHICCLYHVLYPAMILAGFHLIDLLRHIPKRPPWTRFRDPEWRYAVIRLVACGLFVVVGFVHFVVCLPSLMWDMPYENDVAEQSATMDRANLDLRRYLESIPSENKCREWSVAMERASLDLRQYLKNSPCLILSPFSNYLHLKTGSYSALPFCSPSEVMLVDQLRDVQDAMEREDTQYVVMQTISGKNVWLLRGLRFDRFHVVRRFGADIVLLEKTRQKTM